MGEVLDARFHLSKLRVNPSVDDCAHVELSRKLDLDVVEDLAVECFLNSVGGGEAWDVQADHHAADNSVAVLNLYAVADRHASDGGFELVVFVD